MIARVTADVFSGEIFNSELTRDITRSLEQTPLEGVPRDIHTILIFEASKVRSPSPILQDSVRRGGVRGFQWSGDVYVNASVAHVSFEGDVHITMAVIVCRR